MSGTSSQQRTVSTGLLRTILITIVIAFATLTHLISRNHAAEQLRCAAFCVSKLPLVSLSLSRERLLYRASATETATATETETHRGDRGDRHRETRARDFSQPRIERPDWRLETTKRDKRERESERERERKERNARLERSIRSSAFSSTPRIDDFSRYS